jgi:steroid 5-alpha reductase family enzyme
MVLLFFSAIQDVSAQVQNENIRVEDPSFQRENMRTGETITPLGNLTIVIIQALGAILIALFIIIYAIKKRSKGVTNDKH